MPAPTKTAAAAAPRPADAPTAEDRIAALELQVATLVDLVRLQGNHALFAHHLELRQRPPVEPESPGEIPS